MFNQYLLSDSVLFCCIILKLVLLVIIIILHLSPITFSYVFRYLFDEMLHYLHASCRTSQVLATNLKLPSFRCLTRRTRILRVFMNIAHRFLMHRKMYRTVVMTEEFYISVMVVDISGGLFS